MFIITGATGQTGSAVAKALLEKGLPVRVIVRSKEKGEIWEDSGAEVAIADLQDTDALTKAFAGGKVLYLMNPPNYLSEDMFAETRKNITALQTAIADSSLEKLVALSSVGAHLSSGTGNILTLHLLEKSFENSDIPVTFLRAPNFMENWLSALESVINEGILPSFHFPLDRKIPHIATEDIGRIAAETMLEDSQGVQVKELAGFPYSPEDFAGVFSEALQKDVKTVAVPEEEWREIFRHFVSEKNIEAWVEMYQGMNSEYIDFETQNQIEATVTFEDFARKVLNQ